MTREHDLLKDIKARAARPGAARGSGGSSGNALSFKATSADDQAIHNWVRNTIEWTPTWGAIQSAQDTLDKQRGNAVTLLACRSHCCAQPASPPATSLAPSRSLLPRP